ncbi:AI-2E family transporter [Clostridiaceae bacterium HSG29]|nr:AI-2E family transporter [Clostridiaceae bacterium HSG29]
MKTNFDKKIFLMATGVIIIFLIISNPNFIVLIGKAIEPLLYAFAIAYALDKFVMLLTRKTKLSRVLSIWITIIILIAFVIVFSAIVVPNLIDNIVSLVDSLSQIDNFEVPSKFISIVDNEYISEINNYIKDSFEVLISKIGQLSGQLLKSALSQAFAITSGMFRFVLALVIAIYMLFDKKDLTVRLKRLLFAYYDYRKSLNIVRIIEIADNIFSDFFIGKLIDSTIIGILCYIFSNILGIPNALVISIIIGITNMIPYIGPFIGAIPVIIITLLILPEKTIAISLLILALQQFDGLVIGPIILGDKMKVTAFWIIIAVTIGGALKGFIGMLLGVPVLVLIKTIIEELVNDKLVEKNLIGIDELKIPQNDKNGFLTKLFQKSNKS